MTEETKEFYIMLYRTLSMLTGWLARKLGYKPKEYHE